MKTRYQILKHLLLNKDSIYSGADIAATIGISRNQVWKEIQALREEGYQIASHQSKGYELLKLKQTMNPFQILWGLALSEEDLSIMHYPVLTSTNDEAKKYIIQNPGQAALIIADQQTLGRGRGGRDYYSQLSHGLYLSLVLPLEDIAMDKVSLYTLAAGVAMSQALEAIQVHPVKIKWVNDLFVHGKKIGGILCEANTSLENHRIDSIIIGVGVNLAGQLPGQISDFASTVFGPTLADDFNINDLIIAFMKHIFRIHNQALEGDFLREYQKRMLGIGQWVTYNQQGKQSRGQILGINESGHLQVRSQGQVFELIASEVHFDSQVFKENLL